MGHDMRSIIVVFKSLKTCQTVKDMLSGAGYRVDMVCHSGTEVRRSISYYDGGLIISASSLPDMTPDNLYNIIPEGFDMLVRASSKYEFPENTEILNLVKPISSQSLVGTVTMLNKLSEKNFTKKNDLKERTEKDNFIIQEAKKELMSRYSMTEKTAHRFIQKKSMDNGLKMERTAEIILTY